MRTIAEPTAASPPSPGRLVAGRVLLLAALCLVGVVGCALARPTPLDLPPGHRAVLGRIDLSRFEALEALLEIVREDGAFRHDLRMGLGRRDFAITLPPGHYRIFRVRLVDDRQTSPTQTIREIRVAFDVGPEPTVYIGTLQLISTFAQKLHVSVLDEFDDTVPALRARHPDIAEPVARSLFRPA